MTPGLRFSTDSDDLDRELVHRWLSEQAYWALGRSRERNEAAIAGSRAYGVYDADTGAQLGFARVITDGALFGWLADVFVDPDARGRGVGKALMSGIVADLEPLGLLRVALRTSDAHGLYEQFGFQLLDEPALWMTRTAR